MPNRTRVRVVLAQNLETLMQKKLPLLSTQEQVAAKAGVSQRTISNLLRPDAPDMKAPKLDVVEKVAAAFGLATWQLLLDRATVGGELADLLLRPAAPDERLHENGITAPAKLEGTKKQKARG